MRRHHKPNNIQQKEPFWIQNISNLSGNFDMWSGEPYFQFSTDNETWSDTFISTLTPNMKVYIRKKTDDGYYTTMSAPAGKGIRLNNGVFRIGGYLSSLCYKHWEDKKEYANNITNCWQMFIVGGKHLVVDAGELVIPFTKHPAYCYQSMFEDFYSLITAPKFPRATDNGDYGTGCFNSMFANCNNLTLIDMTGVNTNLGPTNAFTNMLLNAGAVGSSRVNRYNGHIILGGQTSISALDSSTNDWLKVSDSKFHQYMFVETEYKRHQNNISSNYFRFDSSVTRACEFTYQLLTDTASDHAVGELAGMLYQPQPATNSLYSNVPAWGGWALCLSKSSTPFTINYRNWASTASASNAVTPSGISITGYNNTNWTNIGYKNNGYSYSLASGWGGIGANIITSQTLTSPLRSANSYHATLRKLPAGDTSTTKNSLYVGSNDTSTVGIMGSVQIADYASNTAGTTWVSAPPMRMSNYKEYWTNYGEESISVKTVPYRVLLPVYYNGRYGLMDTTAPLGSDLIMETENTHLTSTPLVYTNQTKNY